MCSEPPSELSASFRLLFAWCELKEGGEVDGCLCACVWCVCVGGGGSPIPPLRP